jgi:hypothetical protein
MHSQSKVAEVLALRETGLGARRIAKKTGLPLATVRDWLAGRLPHHSRPLDPDLPVLPSCHRCGAPAHRCSDLPPEYVYLLGLYLGDGCISSHPRGVFRLRIFLDLRYPTIIEDAATAIAVVVPRNKVHRLNRWGNYKQSDEPSNVEVSAFSKVWPCLFPQHGPGRKHNRPIFLARWQARLVARWPHQLLRGLIHSDGCRFQNTGRGGWSWPRYAFSNKSDGIRDIFCDACDEFGVRWTRSGERTIYVSRKADVAKLDEFIGPKR